MQHIFSKNFEEITLQDVEFLISNCSDEDQHLEYKEDFSDPKKIAKEIAGFANAEGGLLIFGIKEDQDENGSKVFTIKGTGSKIGNTGAEEFLVNSISQNLYPIPNIKGPLKIEVNEGEYLWLINTPRSYEKPHIMSGDGRFFIRYGSSSIPATRMQVEQMFSSSRQNKIDFEELLSSRKLNINSPDFLENYYSKQIRNFYRLTDENIGSLDIETPLLNLSVIPVFDYDKDRLDTSQTSTIKYLIEKMNDTTLPYQEIYLFDDFSTGRYRHDIDGCCFYHHIKQSGSAEQYLRDYIRIYNNGHIETCLSTDIFIHYPNKQLSMVLTPMLAFLDKFLEFSIGLLREAGYTNRVYVQLSFKNIENYIIRSFYNDHHEPDDYSNMTRVGRQTVLQNSQHNKFALDDFINILEFDESKKNQLLQEIEKKILLLFGQNESLSYKDGKLNQQRILPHNWIRTYPQCRGEIFINTKSQINN